MKWSYSWSERALILTGGMWVGRHFGPIFILLHPVDLIRKLYGTLIIFIPARSKEEINPIHLLKRPFCWKPLFSQPSLVIVCFYNNHHHHKESISSFRDVSWDLGVNSFIKSADFLNHKENNEATLKDFQDPSNNAASHNC